MESLQNPSGFCSQVFGYRRFIETIVILIAHVFPLLMPPRGYEPVRVACSKLTCFSTSVNSDSGGAIIAWLLDGIPLFLAGTALSREQFSRLLRQFTDVDLVPWPLLAKKEVMTG